MSGFPVGTATVEAEVHDGFADADRALLDAITLPGSPESGFRLLSAVVAWGFEVRIFVGQIHRSLGDQDPKVWHAYDLVGAMFHRDRVEDMLPAVPDRLIEQVRRVLDVYDTEFREITVEDHRGEMTRIGDVDPDRQGWWWHRVPDRGPVREHLDQRALPPTILVTEIRPRFTPEALVQLDAVTSDPAHYWKRLLDSIARWAADVRTLTHQLTDPTLRPHYAVPVPPGLLYKLGNRDSIHRLLREVPPTLLHRVVAVLDTYDEEYRAITRPDDSFRLPRAARVTRNADVWWWHRTTTAADPAEVAPRPASAPGLPVASATVRSEVDESFAPADRALLDAITRPDGSEPPFRLLSSIAAWGWGVQIFAAQLHRSRLEADLTLWGVFDLVGMLFHRDRVEDLLPAVPDRLTEQVHHALAGYDALFREITVDDEHGAMVRLGEVEAEGRAWWWHRVPDRGPVRDDLDLDAMAPTIRETEIRPHFAPDQLAVLDTVTGHADRPGMNLLDSIASWAANVRYLTRRLGDPRFRERFPTEDPPGLIYTLHLRDSVHRLLRQVPPTLLDPVRAVLDTYDEEYRAITRPDDSNRLPQAARLVRNPDVAWWWHRTPIR